MMNRLNPHSLMERPEDRVGTPWLDSADRERTRLIVWGAAFAVAVIWPLFVFPYPSGQDIPNHLARAFILLNPDEPALGQHFQIIWRTVPNLAWDAFVVVVGKWFPLAWTLKLFILSGLALTMAGLFFLNRTATGRWTWAPLLAVPFLFNTGHAKGFLNFNIGFGLTLISCAWWAASSKYHWALRLGVASALSTLLYFCHFVGWGIYGVFVLGLEIAALLSQRRKTGHLAIWPWLGVLLRDGLQALPPLILGYFAAATGAGNSLSAAAKIEFQPPHLRLVEAWHFIDTGHWFPSVVFLAAITSLFLFLLASKRIRLVPAFTIPIALLIVLFWVLPNELYSTYYIVWRVGLGAVFLTAASISPKQMLSTPFVRLVLGTVLVLTLGLSSWEARSTANTEAGRKAFAALIQRLPEGSTLFMMHSGIKESALAYDRLGLYHIGSFAVIERKVMVQSLFSNPSQQPISYRDKAFSNFTISSWVFKDDLLKAMTQQGLSLSDHLQHFDWIVTHGMEASADSRDLPLEGFKLTGSNGDFRLYCKIGPSKRSPPEHIRSLCPDNQP